VCTCVCVCVLKYFMCTKPCLIDLVMDGVAKIKVLVQCQLSIFAGACNLDFVALL